MYFFKDWVRLRQFLSQARRLGQVGCRALRLLILQGGGGREGLFRTPAPPQIPQPFLPDMKSYFQLLQSAVLTGNLFNVNFIKYISDYSQIRHYNCEICYFNYLEHRVASTNRNCVLIN